MCRLGVVHVAGISGHCAVRLCCGGAVFVLCWQSVFVCVPVILCRVGVRVGNRVPVGFSGAFCHWHRFCGGEV